MPRGRKRKNRGNGPGRPHKKGGEYPPGFNWALNLKPETKRSIFIILFLALALITLLSLFDLAGGLGQFWQDTIFKFFGWSAVLLPLLFLFISYVKIRQEKMKLTGGNIAGIIMFFVGLAGLFHAFYDPDEALEVVADGRGGGYLGYAISYPLQAVAGFWAALIILFALFFTGTLLMFNLSFSDFINRLKQIKDKSKDLSSRGLSTIRKAMPKSDVEIKEIKDDSGIEMPNSPSSDAGKNAGDDFTTKPLVSESAQTTITPPKIRNYKPFPLDLLDGKSGKPTAGDIHSNSRKIQDTLKNFGIEVEMGDVNVGPTVTQYTLKPSTGVKINQIVTLQNDIALGLAAHPIRIEAPIPGKSLVGIEVPNEAVATVRLRELLESKTFMMRRSNLMVVLGKDVAGSPVIANLHSMPHLLIAGATGSGKSVCLNTVILSLLYQNSPRHLRIILVDPKKVEMTHYNNLPHLLTPVVTEVNKTVNALRWTVAEMDRRFHLLSETHSRDIFSYNQKARHNPLAYIAVVIDELADLMAVAPNEVEACVVRLAQMARAVGIHLVLATQRPSVNVITGLIKANITTRIAFTVASQIDSRTIIDTSGAEKLLGSGDMLFTTAELSKPRRIQGAFVEEKEVERVCEFLKAENEPEYIPEVTEKQSANVSGNPQTGFDLGDQDDDLYEEAKQLVIQAGKASASFLQRRLRIGYARAARILDLLEEEGIIGPGSGAKAREILVDTKQSGDEIPPLDDYPDVPEIEESADEDLPIEEEKDENNQNHER